MAYKRTSKKTGSNTRVTTTTNSKGSRNTFSTKSSLGGKNTRTHSRSHKNGQMRITTTDNVNGWVTRKTKVYGSKPKRTSGRRSRKSKGDGLLFKLILWMMFLPFKIMWWMLKKLFGR